MRRSGEGEGLERGNNLSGQGKERRKKKCVKSCAFLFRTFGSVLGCLRLVYQRMSSFGVVLLAFLQRAVNQKNKLANACLYDTREFPLLVTRYLGLETALLQIYRSFRVDSSLCVKIRYVLEHHFKSNFIMHKSSTRPAPSSFTWCRRTCACIFLCLKTINGVVRRSWMETPGDPMPLKASLFPSLIPFFRLLGTSRTEDRNRIFLCSDIHHRYAVWLLRA
jgi:hypothetical protein